MFNSSIALAAGILGLCTSIRGAESALRITSPAERSVFQRDTNGVAQVRVVGYAPDDWSTLALRVRSGDGRFHRDEG
jgi:hypothetical protein